MKKSIPFVRLSVGKSTPFAEGETKIEMPYIELLITEACYKTPRRREVVMTMSIIADYYNYYIIRIYAES